jgi:hypothetical protein
MSGNIQIIRIVLAGEGMVGGSECSRGDPLLRTPAGDSAMNATVEQVLLSKIKALTPQQVAEVEDFVDFLAAKTARRAAIGRLLAIAPALEAVGAEPPREEEIAAEVKAARSEQNVRKQSPKRSGAGRP